MESIESQARDLYQKYESQVENLTQQKVKTKTEYFHDVLGLSKRGAVRSTEGCLTDKYTLQIHTPDSEQSSTSADNIRKVDNAGKSTPGDGLVWNVYFDEGDIKFSMVDMVVTVGDFADLLDLDVYASGSYTTENGITIRLVPFIQNITFSQTVGKNIQQTPRTYPPNSSLTKRMYLFNGVLFNRLRGDLRQTR
jgi:hypothetical protein